MSVREEIQQKLITYLKEREIFTAPYGILDGKHTSPNGRTYRSVTFGKARTLDATIKIYGESYFLMQWQGSLFKAGHGQNSAVFHSYDELIEFLDENT